MAGRCRFCVWVFDCPVGHGVVGLAARLGLSSWISELFIVAFHVSAAVAVDQQGAGHWSRLLRILAGAQVQAFDAEIWLLGMFIVLAQLAPVVLFPIFYKFEPLDNEDLRRRLVVLSERAGTRVRGVYRWKLSEKSKKANAALTGLGATRRIILADTLLDNYTPEEIEAVLAHELGHHVHRHILKSIFVQAGITLFGFWAANWVLHYAVH